MTITAKIIADSVSIQGIRITTLQLRYPKFIHGEFMTHRVFSRNASSSRAIPVERLIQDVMGDPAMPSKWFKNKPGMQGTEECGDIEQEECVRSWLRARDNAVDTARWLTQFGIHKQHVNRVIEPFCHINVVVTATEWDNFFALRCHPDAQPEMRLLAEVIRDARTISTPVQLEVGDWHLPYVGNGYCNNYRGAGLNAVGQRTLVQLSVARCARVSYLTQEGKEPNIEEDLKLYERLVGAIPLHASPAEHQATPDKPVAYEIGSDTWVEVEPKRWTPAAERSLQWLTPKFHGNFKGWIQYRKTIEAVS